MRSRDRLTVRCIWEPALGVEGLEERRLLSGIEGGPGQGSRLAGDYAEVSITPLPGMTGQESGMNVEGADSQWLSGESNLSDAILSPDLGDGQAPGGPTQSADRASDILQQPGSERARSDGGEEVDSPNETSSSSSDATSESSLGPAPKSSPLAEPNPDSAADPTVDGGPPGAAEPTPDGDGLALPVIPSAPVRPKNATSAGYLGLSDWEATADGTEAFAPGAGSSDVSSQPAPGPGVPAGVGPVRLARAAGTTQGTTRDGSLLARGEASTSLVMAAIDCTASPAPTLRSVSVTGARSRADGRVIASGATELPAPSPRSSDLLTDFLPCGGASVAQAIDRFLSELESLGGEMTGWQSPMGVLPAMATVTIVVLASEVVRRRSRGGETGATAEEGDEDFARVAGFSSAWSFAET
jgi:hypothetical protein